MSDPFVQQYSPLPMGLAGPVAVYMGLGFLAYMSVAMPKWIWWLGVPILCTGLVLEIATKRVVYIRAYQAVVMGIMAAIYGVVLLTVVANTITEQFAIALAVIEGASLVATGIGAYQHNRDRRPDISSWPVGRLWETFNEKTGVVTQGKSSQQVMQQERIRKGYVRLDRLAPLIAGLAMLIAGRLEGSGTSIAISIVAFVTAFGAAASVGGVLFYLLAAVRWERAKRIGIYVKR